MANENHNGWKNYETWLVACHIQNDQGLYEMFCVERPEELYIAELSSADDRATATNAAGAALALEIQSHFETQADEIMETAGHTHGLFADMLQAAMTEVDWQEIGENFIGDLDHAEIEAANREEGTAFPG